MPKTALVSYYANDPGAGLSAAKDLAKFKLFPCDTGLFTTLKFKDRDFSEKLLNDKLPANLGYLYENAVAQTLTAEGNELFYYSFPNETAKRNYEIDFLLTRQGKICPIEVKSSGYKMYASLDAFSTTLNIPRGFYEGISFIRKRHWKETGYLLHTGVYDGVSLVIG